MATPRNSGASTLLTDAIGKALSHHGFYVHHHPRLRSLGCTAFWRRRTWNTNRAVALVERPQPHFDLGAYCQKLKWQFLRTTTSFPVLYTLGLQIVVYGDDLLEQPVQLTRHVDMIDNQIVVLQSLFAVDTARGRYASDRTWGQITRG